MSNLRSFTSESVTEGHPDKVCDRISDAILDAIIARDPQARVAVETLVTTGLVQIAGEVTTESYVEIPALVRAQIADIGYTSSQVGFDGNSCGVNVAIGQQSPDIARGVDRAADATGSDDPRDLLGAGDQGIMFGYACTETDVLMPAPIHLSHRLAEQLARVRHDGVLRWLRPDGKTQVTIGYEQGRPKRVSTVLISTQHAPEISQDELHQALIEHVIHPVLSTHAAHLDTDELQIITNPTGRFVIGGPAGDAGVTGRKIIVDTYGGAARHGGGAFSGKDPSKVDRSATYALRWVAKNVVAAGLAERCELQAAYAIGTARPVDLHVRCFDTARVEETKIEKAISKVFDLRPAAIIEEFDLLRPIYSPLSAYGHFGRADLDLPWEAINRVDQLHAAL